MSDPVDTDALRKAGERSGYYQTGEGPLWRAAADEIDRLRHVRDAWKSSTEDNFRKYQHLRDVIDNAPHSAICDWYEDKPCTCWKSRA